MPRHQRLYQAPPAADVSPATEGPDFDLPPTVSTLEEIEIADELRRELELKYLGKADPCWNSSGEHSHWGIDEDA